MGAWEMVTGEWGRGRKSRHCIRQQTVLERRPSRNRCSLFRLSASSGVCVCVSVWNAHSKPATLVCSPTCLDGEMEADEKLVKVKEHPLHRSLNHACVIFDRHLALQVRGKGVSECLTHHPPARSCQSIQPQPPTRCRFGQAPPGSQCGTRAAGCASSASWSRRARRCAAPHQGRCR